MIEAMNKIPHFLFENLNDLMGHPETETDYACILLLSQLLEKHLMPVLDANYHFHKTIIHLLSP